MGAADILRGRTAGQDYKAYILSLMFYKRLCDQWRHEADEAITEQERQQGRTFTDEQRAVLRRRGDHRFTIPEGQHWADVRDVPTGELNATLTAAMRGVADANEELHGVFTVDWNQPAPDGKGKKLIGPDVVHALVEHFHAVDLSNRSAAPDVLGRAYEFLIKYFADDAGARAGEFFTPPEVVDTLVRVLQPRPGDTVYDPTCGSGGMLVHSGEYLKEQGHRPQQLRYFGQEMNWQTLAIARINAILHGLDAQLAGGDSTLTAPAFTDERGGVRKFSLVMANFPFSDDHWWLRDPGDLALAGKQKKTKADTGKLKKLKDQIFADGYSDPFRRFGKGTAFDAPPAGYGDYAFILHILASLDATGRAGVVCPQGVLFRGQPEQEKDEDDPTSRSRKADAEHNIRQKLLQSGVVDAVIALPLNIFYGAGLPACLLILSKDRPKDRRDKLLLVYGARDFGELSNKNVLRPHDVMRLLIHYHAYGDPARAATLADEHAGRLVAKVDADEAEDVARTEALYEPHAARHAELQTQIDAASAELDRLTKKGDRTKQEKKVAKLRKQQETPAKKLAERDAQVADRRRRAEEERRAIAATVEELGRLYADSDELAKHARVVERSEVEENEWNLNVPRYVDTFEPEEQIDVADALRDLDAAEERRRDADAELRELLKGVGVAYAG